MKRFVVIVLDGANNWFVQTGEMTRVVVGMFNAAVNLAAFSNNIVFNSASFAKHCIAKKTTQKMKKTFFMTKLLFILIQLQPQG